jgi:hypothetical protein
MGVVCSADGEGISVYRVFMGNPEEKRLLGRTGVDGKIILRWAFRKWDVGFWT